MNAKTAPTAIIIQQAFDCLKNHLEFDEPYDDLHNSFIKSPSFGNLRTSGTTMPTEGNNTIVAHSTTSPYTVPEGTDYVTVTFDAATTITATPVAGAGGKQVTGYSQRYLNAGSIQVPNVIPGVTVITTA